MTTGLERVRQLALALVCCLVGSLSSASVSAAPPEDTTTEAQPTATSEMSDADQELDARARQVLLLMQGELPAEVDPQMLFVVHLDDPTTAGQLGSVLARLGQAEAEPQAGPDPGTEPVTLEGLDPASAFATAYAAFLRLPAAEREAILAAHAAKRALASRGADEDQRRAALAAETHQLADGLEAYLDGTLDLAIDPSDLVRVDLLNPTELGLSPERRRGSGVREWSGAPEAEGGEPPNEQPADALALAQRRLDRLRARFVALSVDDRAALARVHRERIADAKADAEAAELAAIESARDEVAIAEEISAAESEAEAAAIARDEALQAAAEARTEALRVVANERARLLGIKEAQARYGAGVTRRKAASAEHHEMALEWKRRVDELESSSSFENEKAQLADPMYSDLRADLTSIRKELRTELGRVRDAGENLPALGSPLDTDLPREVDRSELDALRGEVAAKHRELLALEKAVSWELAQGLRDDVVLLNRTRLRLLELASPSLRNSVTGFGAAGVDQVKREFDQISVELNFHALRLRQYRENLSEKLRGATIPLLIGLAQLALAITAYVWWRRRGDGLLQDGEAMIRERQPQMPGQSAMATAIWYVRRVRGPLEILLVVWLLIRQVDVADLPELELLWLVTLWVLLGSAAIKFVDALAARETRFSASTADTSALRIHSLRLVGLNIVGVGLVLSLTSAMVGKGAIYSWVISTCWLLSFPVLLYLVYKWRPIIFRRLETRVEGNRFARWVHGNQSGLMSFPAAMLAAGYLLGSGTFSWAMRQVSGLEATRRLLAYLFRREVAKQAAATQADQRYRPAGASAADAFDPSTAPRELVEEVGAEEVAAVVGMLAQPHATLSAIVGERGAGKSTFLRRVVERLDPELVHAIRCPQAGLAELEAALARLTDDPEARGSTLTAALSRLAPAVIVIDDLHRLVVPAVNGLRDLDAFVRLLRGVDTNVSWVASFGASAWHYVRRARGESVFFEQVVQLPRWTEDQLGVLIRQRCSTAAIDPSFEGLVVPRQSGAPLPDEGDRTEAGYYRLLWDFSNGNPAVAMCAFRDSLFETEDGTLVVRLFEEPPPAQIEALSLSILFVLRAIVQLDLARAMDVQAATQLAPAEVEDALRFCQSRGYIELAEGRYRVVWPWYRTLTTVLRRQHLLSAR